VNIEIAYCMQPADPSSIMVSGDVSVHENYYVYCLDASSMCAGQYQYRIFDVSALTDYESGLLFKLSENQANKNLSENIIYERY